MFPFPANDTCDIYHLGHAPPNPPDVAGVPVYIVPRFRNIKGNFAGLIPYTHLLYLPLGTDVRDNWSGSLAGLGDILFIPNRTSGFKLGVYLVMRMRLNGSNDYLIALATTKVPGGITYPTSEG